MLHLVHQLFGMDSPKDLCQFAHPPNPPLNFTSTPFALLYYIPRTTEDRTLQDILS